MPLAAACPDPGRATAGRAACGRREGRPCKSGCPRSSSPARHATGEGQRGCHPFEPEARAEARTGPRPEAAPGRRPLPGHLAVSKSSRGAHRSLEARSTPLPACLRSNDACSASSTTMTLPHQLRGRLCAASRTQARQGTSKVKRVGRSARWDATGSACSSRRCSCPSKGLCRRLPRRLPARPRALLRPRGLFHICWGRVAVRGIPCNGSLDALGLGVGPFGLLQLESAGDARCAAKRVRGGAITAGCVHRAGRSSWRLVGCSVPALARAIAGCPATRGSTLLRRAPSGSCRRRVAIGAGPPRRQLAHPLVDSLHIGKQMHALDELGPARKHLASALHGGGREPGFLRLERRGPDGVCHGLGHHDPLHARHHCTLLEVKARQRWRGINPQPRRGGSGPPHSQVGRAPRQTPPVP